MPTHADYEIGPAQVVETLKHMAKSSGIRAVRVRLGPDDVLPREYEGLVPVSTRTDYLGEFLELWYLVSDLKRIH
jgi:hypothetical protein